MKEQTQEALVALAEKLGTTTEYLFHVLVSQARYDVLISVIQLAFCVAFVWATIKLHVKFMKPIPGNAGYTYYNKYEEGLSIAMVFAGIMCLIMIFCFLAGLNDLISAIFNPEYWALRQIMHLLK